MSPVQERRLDESVVRNVVAAAIHARMIPANRLHLFYGIAPKPGIFAAVEALVALGGDITGKVAGKEAFKTARAVTSLLAVHVATSLEQAAAVYASGAFDHLANERVLHATRMARLLLKLDRERNWLPNLTVEKWVHALRQLNKGCWDGFKALTYGPDLLADIRSWLRVKPAKPTHKEE